MKASANRSSVHVKKRLARERSRLEARMVAMVARRDQTRALQERLEASGASHLSEVNPDARHVHKGGAYVVGYNGPIAVDDKTSMIVAVDLVQDGNVGTDDEQGPGGHGEQLKACEEKGMEVYVPLLPYSSRKGSGKHESL